MVEKQFLCLRCKHTWNGRCPEGEDYKKWTPVICPKCKSPYWNRRPKTQRV